MHPTRFINWALFSFPRWVGTVVFYFLQSSAHYLPNSFLLTTYWVRDSASTLIQAPGSSLGYLLLSVLAIIGIAFRSLIPFARSLVHISISYFRYSDCSFKPSPEALHPFIWALTTILSITLRFSVPVIWDFFSSDPNFKILYCSSLALFAKFVSSPRSRPIFFISCSDTYLSTLPCWSPFLSLFSCIFITLQLVFDFIYWVLS